MDSNDLDESQLKLKNALSVRTHSALAYTIELCLSTVFVLVDYSRHRSDIDQTFSDMTFQYIHLLSPYC